MPTQVPPADAGGSDQDEQPGGLSQDEQPVGPNPVEHSGGDGQPRGGPPGVLLAALALLVLVAGAGAAGYWVWSANRDHVRNLTVGDCARQTPDDRNSPYRIVACDDPAAGYRAVRLVPSGGGPGCATVAGASRSVTLVGGVMCLAPVDADPAEAVNAARDGDCLAVRGEQARRVPCGADEARYTVLRRFASVPRQRADVVCDEVAGVVRSYAWNWTTSAGTAPADVDIVLCLGEV